MATFKDANGVEWDIRLDAPTILEVRGECDPSFMNDKGEDSTFGRLADDPVTLCRVLYVVCKDQRQAKNVSEKDFYQGLAGDAIDAATDALLKAIVSFTPRRSRLVLEASAAKTEKIRQIATDRVLAKINDQHLEDQLLSMIDDEMDRVINRVTQRSSATN